MNTSLSPLQKFLLTWLLILLTFGATIYALSYVGELISILLTAALIAFLLNYAVHLLKPVLPRSVAAVLVYLFAALVVIFLGLTLVPPVFNQGRQLITRLPELFAEGQQQLINFQAWSEQRNLPFDVQLLTSQLLVRVQTQAEAIASTGFGLVLGTFNWFLDTILVLVLSFYMLIDGERLWRGVTSILAPRIQVELSKSLRSNLQRFVTGQLLLGLFMATTLSLAFRLLEVPFFLLFAVFIGAMEVIPFVGATLGIGTVAIVVAFMDWWLAVKVIIVAVAIQQVKDNVISPRLMGNLTGLSPVIILVSLLLGAKIGGLLGVILAIPVTGVMKSLAEVIFDPQLPPQTGAFFNNPLQRRVSKAALPGAADEENHLAVNSEQ
ncbi:AI-2E family transporter [Oscillatoria salina]|uniref:AI-2E family transporter n=1 Tax=Oscillatoria salina TaxID=331517 RepID=UPI0013BC28C1|nr:AI-2E family transporter [Oscillatoria salina]MBZ8179665.1 AI-2E family transporter [Oscillatoria salina IIICB1]NET89262.1 AI-2E family transporter [Kamptonema sp. SIO1D9]